MRLKDHWTRSGALAVFTIAMTGSAALAQSLTFAGATEVAGDKVYVLFGELGMAGAGLGLKPVGSVSAHMVFTDGNDGWGVTPAAGLRYRTEGGFVQGKVGYAVRKKTGASGFFGGANNGLYTALQTEFWGSGDLNASGIVNYNWGADYLWSRARVGKRLGTMGTGGSWGLGAELVYQGQTSNVAPGVSGPKTTQIGPVLQFTPREGGPNFAISSGWKQNKSGGISKDTWYAKGEIFVP